MAKSGKCTVTLNSQSIANNTSSVTVKGIIETSGESWRGNERSGTYTIKQGSSVIKSGSFTHGAPKNSTTTLFSVTVTVAHKSNGMSDAITASYNYDSGWCKGSGSLSLATIPRQANITSAPNFNDEANPTIGYSNPAGNAATSLQACISLAGNKADIAYRDIGKTGNSYTFNLTTAERDVLRGACTTANSRKVYFFVKTVLAGNTYYSKLERTLTIVNATPVITNASAKDVNSSITGLTGDDQKIIAGMSNISATMASSTLKGATIKSSRISNGGKTVNGTSATFNKATSNVVKFEVTDSRGNKASKTITLGTVNYVKLTCNVDASIALDGADSTKANIKFKIFGNYWSGKFSADVSNSLTLKTNITDGSGKQTTITLPAITMSDGRTYSVESTIKGLEYTESFVINVVASDKLTKSVKASSKTLKAIPVFDWGENDFNFNVDVLIRNVLIADFVSEQGELDGWLYRKWNSGKCEAWLNAHTAKKNPSYSSHGKDSASSLYRWIGRLSLPSDLFKTVHSSQISGTLGIGWWSGSQTSAALTTNDVEVIFFTTTSTLSSTNVPGALPSIYIVGTWK